VQSAMPRARSRVDSELTCTPLNKKIACSNNMHVQRLSSVTASHRRLLNHGPAGAVSSPSQILLDTHAKPERTPI